MIAGCAPRGSAPCGVIITLLPSAIFLLFLIVAFSAQTVSSQTQVDTQPRCLDKLKEVQPKRFLFYRGQTRALSIESSLRPAHRLVSRIFAIFLREVLGYSYVTVRERDDTLNASLLLNGFHTPPESDANAVPDSMVNLEVPIPPNLDLHSQTSRGVIDVDDCGNLGPVGRFGWFIPEQLVTWSRQLLHLQPSPDHWRIFTRPEWAATFEQNISSLAEYTRDPDTKKYFCNIEGSCTDGMHIPDQCQTSRGKANTCALLLASYPEDTIFVVKQIKILKLFVKVVWVGPHLQFLTEKFGDLVTNTGFGNSTSSARGVVTLSWHPSPLTTARKYTSVSFPACEPDDPGPSWLCSRLALHRLVKAAWTPLRDSARVAFEAIHRLTISTKNYEDLLLKYAKGGLNPNVDKIACDWMNDNKALWDHWVPNTDSERTNLYIGGIFPMGGKTYTARGIMAAASLAINAVNANSTVLRDYTLRLHAFDGQCKADTVMKSFIDYIRLPYFNRVVGILGPACSDTVEPLAGVSKHYKTVIISYSAEGSSFSDREKYPYFFRTIGENKQYKNVYLELFKRLEWRQVASLTEDGQKYTEYISHMQDLLQANDISFVTNRKFPPTDIKSVVMSQYLEDIKSKSARIIIADVYDDAARAVMCEAYRQGMTGRQGYVWFLPLWLSPHWYDSDHFNNASNESINCTTKEMIEAINGHLALAHAYFAPDDAPMQEPIKVGAWRKKYEQRCQKLNVTHSNYAGYAYDAVWTYAYALEKLLSENQSYVADLHSEVATRSYIKHLSETDFNGVSGHVKFRNGPSRVSIINVVQWINNETRTVGSYYPNITDLKGQGYLDLNISAIHWMTPDGVKPEDGTEPPPSCFISPVADFFNTSCEVAIVILNILGIGLIGMILFVVFIIMKRRYERMTQIYMKSMGIDLLPTTSLASLDKWEIARENVVINRKLGEGAFGTVYGGEAYFAEKGWVAVAVKTLKLGSTTEVKLDFLSEAEVMKRLDHQNVVRLLGVCTKNEPVYTVMEFMLYGDLKTFLLARRHLVTERSTEESDEISSKKLTNMALDVARALTYLADLKYVHRDVACRNCMVNANRVVKLGDFGMTRAMYESDYYRFNRKGMLPVRWMAPESLVLGIFTPQSDIWSYGVLLYEIITFGSFPFQGMSNSQVLEYVKNGSTLNIPKGVKGQLEGLLKSCWLPDYKKRLNASEIVEILANNPRLIAPCLDVPLASVQMEDTGQLELQLPEKSRKCSVSLNKTRHRSLSGGSHAATTPNSPTSIEPGTKLARSATAQDVMQAIPLLPAPPNNARHATSSPNSPDTVPLLFNSVRDADILDITKPPMRSVTVPMLPPPPSNMQTLRGEVLQENGSILSPHRRSSGNNISKYVGYQPGQRIQENGDVEQATSVL